MLVPFGTHVRDREGKSVGTVSRLVLHPESRQVVGTVVQQGVINRRELVVPMSKVARRATRSGSTSAVPAGVIAAVGDDRITLRVGADEVKRLERGVTDKLGTAPAA
jgi:sporulation protein YlmC with PRC-barrel domain